MLSHVSMAWDKPAACVKRTKRIGDATEFQPWLPRSVMTSCVSTCRHRPVCLTSTTEQGRLTILPAYIFTFRGRPCCICKAGAKVASSSSSKPTRVKISRASTACHPQGSLRIAAYESRSLVLFESCRRPARFGWGRKTNSKLWGLYAGRKAS